MTIGLIRSRFNRAVSSSTQRMNVWRRMPTRMAAWNDTWKILPAPSSRSSFILVLGRFRKPPWPAWYWFYQGNSKNILPKNVLQRPPELTDPFRNEKTIRRTVNRDFLFIVDDEIHHWWIQLNKRIFTYEVTWLIWLTLWITGRQESLSCYLLMKKISRERQSIHLYV